MTRNDLLAFLRTQRLGVVTSLSGAGAPQAAVVGIAVTDELEIVFDTVRSSRKYANLQRDPRVALVIGRDDGITVQLEGEAREPSGPELRAYQEAYFQAFPDGRERLAWTGIVHLLVRPHWVRYSDFRTQPERIVEMDLS